MHFDETNKWCNFLRVIFKLLAQHRVTVLVHKLFIFMCAFWGFHNESVDRVEFKEILTVAQFCGNVHTQHDLHSSSSAS